MGRPRASYRRITPTPGHRVVEHRWVAMHALGRRLAPGEVVHHCDGDPGNNRPDNLRVLPSQRVHMALEWFLRRHAHGVEHLFDLETWLTIYAANHQPRQPD